MALPALGLLVVPALWRAVPTEGTGARLDLLGAVLVAATASGLVLLVQSPSSGVAVAVAGALLLALGVPAATARVRRRPEGFLPAAVVREPVVVRSALAASCVPAAWFALLIAVPAVLAVAWLDAAAGRAGARPERCHRLPGTARRRPAARPPRPDPVAGHLRRHGRRSRSCSPRPAPPSARPCCSSARSCS